MADDLRTKGTTDVRSTENPSPVDSAETSAGRRGMMMRGQKAGTSQQAQTLPASMSQVDSMAPPRPQATVLQDIQNAGEDVVTSSLTQEDGVKPFQSVNGQQPTVSTPAASRAEATPPPQE